MVGLVAITLTSWVLLGGGGYPPWTDTVWAAERDGLFATTVWLRPGDPPLPGACVSEVDTRSGWIRVYRNFPNFGTPWQRVQEIWRGAGDYGTTSESRDYEPTGESREFRASEPAEHEAGWSRWREYRLKRPSSR